MGRTGLFFSTLAIAAGAVMHWAVTTAGHGFNVSTVGIILMVVGVIGLVASGIVFATSRRPAGTGKRTYDRQATDAHGQSTQVHEEVHS
ncbi:MAG: hypothetical protein ABSG36_03440 [Acidimicrobiales bacterium]|jgi:hypothetical protein